MGHDPQLRGIESARLDSWKEIAAFLHRDARTVRRWERERRLPVHRVPGGERSGVFAYVAELERWLHAAGPVTDNDPSQTNASSSVERSAVGLTSASETHLTPDSEEIDLAAAKSLSAFHSLNAFATTFVSEAIAIEDDSSARAPDFDSPVTVRRDEVIPTRVPWHLGRYRAVALIVLLGAAVGISAAVIHYRENKPLNTVAHQVDPEARELYLRGRYYWNLRTEDGLNRAVDLFTQSIVNDPHYAAAYAGLADAYLLLRQYGHMPDSEAYPRALAAARQAIALDDSCPEAHRSLAFALRFWNWDMASAESEYRRAIALNPNDSQSHHWYATALQASGRNREALAEIDLARVLEPQSLSVLADRGLILASIDPRASLVALQQVEQAQPDFVSTHRYLAGTYLQMEDYGAFLTESRTAAELSHDSATVLIVARAQKVLSRQGPKAMLRQMAAELGARAGQGSSPAYHVAHLFGLAGENGEAIRYLRLACEQRDPGFLNVANDPAFVQLHSLPAYNTLITQRDVATTISRQPIARLDLPDLAK